MSAVGAGRAVARKLVKIVGAVMIGVGTIFAIKRRPDDHWSTPPTQQVDPGTGGESTGDPPGTD